MHQSVTDDSSEFFFSDEKNENRIRSQSRNPEPDGEVRACQCESDLYSRWKNEGTTMMNMKNQRRERRIESKMEKEGRTMMKMRIY